MTVPIMMCYMNFFLIIDSKLLCIIIVTGISRKRFKVLFDFLPIKGKTEEMS